MNDKRKTRLILSNEKTDESVVYLTHNECTRCLFCTLDIVDTHKAVGCPIKYIENHIDVKHNDRQHSGDYISHGTFCSYNCAKAYAIEKQQYDPTFANSCRYINIIINKNSDKVIDLIQSPPKELMRIYGGYMTNEQYKSEIGKILYVYNGSTVLHPVALVYNRKIQT